MCCDTKDSAAVHYRSAVAAAAIAEGWRKTLGTLFFFFFPPTTTTTMRRRRLPPSPPLKYYTTPVSRARRRPRAHTPGSFGRARSSTRGGPSVPHVLSPFCRPLVAVSPRKSSRRAAEKKPLQRSPHGSADTFPARVRICRFPE